MRAPHSEDEGWLLFGLVSATDRWTGPGRQPPWHHQNIQKEFVPQRPSDNPSVDHARRI